MLMTVMGMVIFDTNWQFEIRNPATDCFDAIFDDDFRHSVRSSFIIDAMVEVYRWLEGIMTPFLLYTRYRMTFFMVTLTLALTDYKSVVGYENQWADGADGAGDRADGADGADDMIGSDGGEITGVRDTGTSS